MNILLVYPEIPSTFWSFKEALKFVSKKSSEPPLGLLTVAALLPAEWEKKLIDMNVTNLKDRDLKWADYVFLSGMNIHLKSIKEIINRCKDIGVKIVAGGPFVTMNWQELPEIDHFVLNEAEITLPEFLKDMENDSLKRVYTTTEYPDILKTPIPLWNLLDLKNYASLSVQYSRGCPFNCEFCSITILNGRVSRVKSKNQFLGELDALYNRGWRGAVFIVDDNFIGNKGKLKNDLLPALIEWSEERKYPFHFTTEVSINLADDLELVSLMVQAGFVNTFIGIETPDENGLKECGKIQNQKRDLLESVKILQRCGLLVSGGFIVGFDSDTPKIFEKQIEFIQQSGIVTAMVGLLNAPSGTRLFNRMKSEKRLLKIMSGDNMDGSMNFIPKMDKEKLNQGYRKILKTVYSPKEYYKRVKTLIKEYKMPVKKPVKISFSNIKAFIKSIWVLGIRDKGKRYYWKLFFYSLFKHPGNFAISITMAIYGYHFSQVAGGMNLQEEY